MNEWAIIISVVSVGAVVFGAVWIIIQEVKKSLMKYIEDVKKSAHARIDRCDHAIDSVANTKNDFITIGAFDRFEANINNRLDGMQSQMTVTNSRIDDLILAIKNGGIK